MKTLIACLATALVTSGAALGFGAPWSEYTEGPQKCAIVDTLTRQVSIVKLGAGTTVVSYTVTKAGVVEYDGAVPRFARALVGDGSKSYSLKRTCR